MIPLSEDDPTVVLMKRIAREYRMTLKEVNALVCAAVSAEIDPLPFSEMGEPFRFRSDRPPSPHDYLNIDFYYLNEVPPPNAIVDLRKCLSKAKDDAEIMEMVLERVFEIEQWGRAEINEFIRAARNALDWSLFWSRRWPGSQERRDQFKEEAKHWEEMIEMAPRATKRPVIERVS
jgi:hypothetical protein